MESKIYAVQPIFNWKEEDSSLFIGTKNYDNAIAFENQDQLNDINRKKLQIAKKQLTMFDLTKVKPGDILYDPEHGYVRVDQVPPMNKNKEISEDVKWDCYKQPQKQESEDAVVQDPVKLHISPLKFTNFIEITAILQVEQKQLMCQAFKVKVTDKISEIIEPLLILYNVKAVTIWHQKQLNHEWTFYDHGIKDKDTIHFFGVSAIPGAIQSRGSGKVRYFKRFREANPSSGWYIGRESWDGLIIIPSRNVNILGVGIFEFRSTPLTQFTYGYKYMIKDENDAEIEPMSQVYEEQITPTSFEEHFFYYRFQNFPRGIPVRQGQRFLFLQWIQGVSQCYYAEGGDQYRELPNEEPNVFEFQHTSLSTNSTTVGRGIIPAIIYS